MKAEHLVRRVFYSLLAFMISVSLTFVLLHLMPGDYLHSILPYLAEKNPDAARMFREQFGLNRSISEQYLLYMVNIIQGNWGYSFLYGLPVLAVIEEKLRWTLVILFPSTVLSIFIGMAVGAYSGWINGSKTDLSVLNFMIFVGAVPSYWWAMLLILIFGFHMSLFPLGGYASIDALDVGVRISDVLRHAALPITALTISSVPGTYYLMRNSTLQTTGEEYVLTARSKGLREMEILRHHALKNAMLPMVTVIALELAQMIMGSVFVETIFSWPGLGLLTFEALRVRDLPLLQGIFLMDTLMVILANIVADLSYPFIDPRVKVGESV